MMRVGVARAAHTYSKVRGVIVNNHSHHHSQPHHQSNNSVSTPGHVDEAELQALDTV
jgi:hypothetical protein